MSRFLRWSRRFRSSGDILILRAIGLALLPPYLRARTEPGKLPTCWIRGFLGVVITKLATNSPASLLHSAKGSVYYFAVRIEGVLSAGKRMTGAVSSSPPARALLQSRMMRWPVAPTAKSLLIYVGGVVTTIFGSWVSGKLRVYDDSRKAHLDDIKQKVLIPLRDGLLEHYGPLVSHRSHVVIGESRVRQQKRSET